MTGPGDTVLGDTSQTQEDASCVTPLTGGPRGVRRTEMESRQWVAGAGEGKGVNI